MGDFGTKTIEPSDASFNNAINGLKAQCPEAGIAQSITIYIHDYGPTDAFKCALYDSGKNFIAETEEHSGGGADGWYTLTFASPPSISAGAWYYICGFGAAPRGKYHSSGGVEVIDKYLTYDSWPDPLIPGGTYPNFDLSIYCTYTPLGWSGKVSEVTNPAKVMGVDVANIAKVKGVASA